MLYYHVWANLVGLEAFESISLFMDWPQAFDTGLVAVARNGLGDLHHVEAGTSRTTQFYIKIYTKRIGSKKTKTHGLPVLHL